MKSLKVLLSILILAVTFSAGASIAPPENVSKTPSLQERLQSRLQKQDAQDNAGLIFDLPVTNNKYVSHWIDYFQRRGKTWFAEFLSRSHRYLPLLKSELEKRNLPQDLSYMVMIESGFSPTAISSARAVGPWQFMAPTAKSFGLRMNWWLDERRDFLKSTGAAADYLSRLKSEFKSWYLVIASYNMGEGALRRQIRKYKTDDYWQLVRLKAIPEETRDYVPKILAAMLIAKAPALYGFRDIAPMQPLEFDLVRVPGGTNLNSIADHIQVTHSYLKTLNAELLLGEIPAAVPFHHIKVPKGAGVLVQRHLNSKEHSLAME